MSEPQENIVDALQSFLDSRLTDVHTSIPGKIISYNSDTERASVQPVIKVRRKVNEDIITVEIPPIDNVPVMMLHTTHFRIKVPLVKGDGVEIIFSEVGIGNFLNGTGGLVDPDDLSRFSLTDAYCIPGLWGKNLPNSTPTFEIDKLGNLILLGGSSPFVKGDDLETLLNNFLTALSNIVPGSMAQNAAALVAIQVAATAALVPLPTIKSIKIKGA